MKDQNKSIVADKAFTFAVSIVELYKELIKNREYVLSKQLLKSSTSIGANIEEALAAQSKRDFLSKISISSKEARETHYWLRLYQETQIVSNDYSDFIDRVEELIRMLTSIAKTTRENLTQGKK